MLNQSLISLFERDIDHLNTELNAYKNKEIIWQKAPGILNSAGNLSLHLAGNLHHFIGAVLGKSDYVRDREFEFGGTVPFEELPKRNTAAKTVVIDTLQNLAEEELSKNYPIPVFGEEMTTEFFLSHLYGHFNYHLGQINYHRRLLDKADQ